MSARILFVCLGNICRSPLAEGIFAHMVRERGLDGRYLADSAGTGDWHIGQPPDPRSVSVAQRRGVRLPSLGRQVGPDDFRAFDLILAMDRSNLKDLRALCPPGLQGKIRLMREFDSERGGEGGSGSDVPDPYYGGPYEFDRVYEMLNRCCAGLLGTLENGTPAIGNATAP